MLQFTVDNERCNRCGLCARDCVARIIEQTGDALPAINPANETRCMQCQHCLAVCPTGAVSILGRSPAHSIALSPDSLPGLEQMDLLLRARRSTRHYKDENVDAALLRRLLATLANAPTGANRRELTFHVIDDRQAMQRLRVKTLTALAAAVNSNSVPERLTYMRQAVPAYYEQGIDIIFRGAPHALIVSAPTDAPCPREDVALALAQFELLAQCAGLGTVWWGMLKMLMAMLPELEPLLGVPKEHVYYAMLFGQPAIHFARTVQRDDAARVERVTV